MTSGGSDSKSSGVAGPPATVPAKPPTHERLQRLATGAFRFGRDFTAGVNRRELERLFDEDARGALTVLVGERRSELEHREGALRALHLTRRFFVGLAMKLSPARRLLFAAALLSPLLGLLDFEATIGATRFFIDFSPLWFLVSIAGLTLLLALELVDRLRVRDELEVARALQRELLPREIPEVAGYRIAHSYRTANEIGGDYYDFLPLADGRLVLAVGDASGHGISAGLLMAIANSTLKLAIELDPSPAAVLELLNRVLCRTGSRRQFMSLFYAVLDPQTGELELASAGHPFPLLRRSSGQVLELGRGSLPLGMRRDVEFESQTARLEPGDFLVLYSDGLPEAVGGEADESFGFDRLKGLLAYPQSPQQVHDKILAAVDRHLEDRDLTDDLTLVVLDRAPALPAR
jgi:hypothetical protein